MGFVGTIALVVVMPACILLAWLPRRPRDNRFTAVTPRARRAFFGWLLLVLFAEIAVLSWFAWPEGGELLSAGSLVFGPGIVVALARLLSALVWVRRERERSCRAAGSPAS